MEDLEDGLGSRGAATWDVGGKTDPRKVILPAEQATESQPRLCDLSHICEGPVGVAVPSESHCR